ncbi:MAG TPA: carboxypeptidase-like regulatory domain-containing protein [Thermoanaerobaculia bacterium]|nr:carboxypeptidase-like regulatory domain-containing protein [Thermoanaerobaculia bacterium]
MAGGNGETVRHRAAIVGRAKDARTGEPLAGVRIEITAGPPAFAGRLALSARDGFFHFLDLPAGRYTLSGSLPGSGTRYGTATAEVLLSADAQSNVVLGTADLALPATTVQGQVRSGPDAPVWMAEVRIQGSGESAWSDAKGNFVIAGLEAGTRRLIVTARGFPLRSETVTLGRPGDMVTHDVTLSPS